MHGVGHDHSDAALGIRIPLCEACCHEFMVGYMLLYFAYMCHFVCLVEFSSIWLHSYMLGCTYHSCRNGYKYHCSCLVICIHVCV